MSLENLFAAWREFRRGKKKKRDIQEFGFELEDNLFSLREGLISQTYRHWPYESFYVQDPKLRHIHKSYLGVLSHADAYELAKQLENML